MKLSTEGKGPHGKAGKVWLRALARKIKNWLDAFLEEDAASQAEETRSHSHTSTSATLVSDRHPQEQSSLAALPATEEAGSPELSKSTETGPPADWLERVQKGAPELLVPVEEGGTPWQTALEATAQAISAPKHEVSPKISKAPRSQWPLSGRGAARLRTSVSSRPNATSATVRWWERLRLKLMPTSAARRSTNLKAEPPQNPSSAISHRLAVPNEPRFRHQPVSPTPVLKSAQPVVFKSHDPVPRSQTWMQRVRQILLRPLRSVSGGNSFKKVRTASSELVVSSREAAGETVPQEIQPGRSIPKWPQWFPSAESAPTERSWTSPPDRIQSPRTETRTTSDVTVKPSLFFSHRPIAEAREKRDSVTSVFSGWSEPTPSRWPDLPQDPTTGGEDWRQAFREWTRAQALDREQRGKG